jgi:hypothetical protein
MQSKGYLKATREPYLLHWANSSGVMALNAQQLPHYGWNIIFFCFLIYSMGFHQHISDIKFLPVLGLSRAPNKRVCGSQTRIIVNANYCWWLLQNNRMKIFTLVGSSIVSTFFPLFLFFNVAIGSNDRAWPAGLTAPRYRLNSVGVCRVKCCKVLLRSAI